MGEVLSEEQLEIIADDFGHDSELLDKMNKRADGWRPTMGDVLDSHEALRRQRDEAMVWAKNWEAACEAKNKQLDEYDEAVAASEMMAIERSGCDAAMREMEIAQHESSRLLEERGAAIARAEKAEKERDDSEARCKAAVALQLASDEQRDTFFDKLHEIIGIANGDDGPPQDEWSTDDPAEAVRGLFARAEAADADAERLRRDFAAVVRERDEARESVKVGLQLIHELRTRAETAEARCAKVEQEKGKIEREWETLATMKLDCDFDRMMRKQAESRARGIREALEGVVSAVAWAASRHYAAQVVSDHPAIAQARAAIAATKEGKP